LPDDEKLNSFKAIGEDSSAKILSAYLRKLGLKGSYVNPKDAGIMLKNDRFGAQLLPESLEQIYKLREKDGICVIPGFFGFTKNGSIATCSRGGSAITGSIIPACVKADLSENLNEVVSVYSDNH